MQVYLIRHTTPSISRGICYGQTDIGLDPNNFERELKNIQSKLPNDIERFYTSPLQRCKILTERISPDFVVDERLMELNFGDWENKSWNEIDQTELNHWMQDFVNVKTPNGENYVDLHNRTLDFVNETLKSEFKKIAIITHAGNIRSFMSFVLSLLLESSFRINLNYGTAVSVKLDKLEHNNKLLSII